MTASNSGAPPAPRGPRELSSLSVVTGDRVWLATRPGPAASRREQDLKGAHAASVKAALAQREM